MGICGGLLLRRVFPAAGCVFFLLPWLVHLPGLRDTFRGGRGFAHLLVLGVGLTAALLRLPSPPELAENVEIAGRWQDTQLRRGGVFTGTLVGRPRLRVRGLGVSPPAPGTAFTGRALILPAWERGKLEARLLSWQAEYRESAATWASRNSRPDRHRRLARALTASYPEREGPLARALLLGERSDLSRRAKHSFRRAGLAHLLALSGLHVGLLLLLLRRLLGLAGFGPFRAEWLLLALLPVLPAALGSGPSIFRAVSMAAYVLVVRRLGGRPLPYEALACAASLELLLRPASLLAPGFQLSYVATFALIARFRSAAPPPLAAAPRLLLRLREAFALSVTCSLATLPVTVIIFDRLPLMGPLWNLLASPLCALALWLGWLTLPFSPLPFGTILVRPAAWTFAALSSLAHAAAGMPPSPLTGFSVPLWAWFFWSLGLALVALGAGWRTLVGFALMLLPPLIGSLPPIP